MPVLSHLCNLIIEVSLCRCASTNGTSCESVVFGCRERKLGKGSAHLLVSGRLVGRLDQRGFEGGGRDNWVEGNGLGGCT